MAEEQAEEAPAAAGEGDADAPEAKSKKKLLFIILGAVVVIGGAGGGAAFFMMSPSEETVAPSEGDVAKEGEAGDADPKAEATAGEESAEGAKEETAEGSSEEGSNVPPGVNFGNTYTFKTFHLNLGNPLENHYIRLEIAVEYKGGEEQRKEIEQRLPQLRDAVVSVTSRKTREFLLGPDGKDQLRREVLIRMNRYMTQPIESVFLTDILIE